jgi:hypothetical protein
VPTANEAKAVMVSAVNADVLDDMKTLPFPLILTLMGMV